MLNLHPKLHTSIQAQQLVSVVIPAAAYSMVFLFGSVLVTVELPQLFQREFGFGAQQLGLQSLGIIIGSAIGEQLGGVLSDHW